MELRATVDERDARAVSPQIEGRDSGGILAADHQYIGVVVGMSLGVIVRNLRQIFAGQTELIGEVVVSGGDDHFAGVIVVRTAGAVGGGNTEVSVFAHHCLDPLVLPNVEMVMLGDLAVVLKSLFASGLLVALW